MAEITVCIEIDEQGQITVGQEPPEDDGSESDGQDPGLASAQAGQMTDLSQPAGDEEDTEKSYMQPVKSIDEALKMARQILQQAAPQGGSVMGTPGAPGEQDAANSAFASRRGGKAMPGGY